MPLRTRAKDFEKHLTHRMGLFVHKVTAIGSRPPVATPAALHPAAVSLAAMTHTPAGLVGPQQLSLLPVLLLQLLSLIGL